MKYDTSKPFDLQSAKARFDKLCQEGAKIELKKFAPIRSNENNAYFHVVVGYFCLETGYTMKEAKVKFKRYYGLVYKKDGETYETSTTTLTDKELVDFTEYIRQFCLDNLGLYIPTPEEWRINQFDIAKELAHVMG